MKGAREMMSATTARRAGLVIFLLLAAAALLTLGLAKLGNTQQANAVVTHLWATSGTVTMPDGTEVPIWGLTQQDPAQGGVAALPGPKLEVNQGDQVSVVLHNNLSRKTSLIFPGQNRVPDTTGVAPGGQKTYTFTANRPGTYLYESGIEPEKQVQMGLYGALIVHPTTAGQAYNDPATAYDTEAVMVLSEIDPALHANPDSSYPSSYAPKYFLINGKAYPQTDPISARAGDKVLFRYLNAGSQNHSLQLLGMNQTLIARDAFPLNYSTTTFSQMVVPGETFDLISTVPASAGSSTKFPIYSRDLRVTNNASSNGGMTTFVEVQ
jgi:FtsP/CotA-like multicopper oxidase with cupredoxin domain